MVDKKQSSKTHPKHKNIFWQNLFYGTAYSVLNSPLPEVTFVAALVLSRDQPGLYFNYTSHFWIPIVLLGLVAALAYFGYQIVFGKGSASHVAALIFSYCIYGYYTLDSRAHSLFPRIFATPLRFHILQAILVVIITAVFAGLVTFAMRWITSRYTILKNLQAYKILFTAVLILFIVEALHFIKRYFVIH